MRIAINALFWSPGRTGGSETYLRALLGEWHRTLADPVVVFAGPRARAALAGLTRWEIVAVPFDEDRALARLRAEQVALPGLVHARAPDVLFSPGNFVPLRARVPQVVTVHDLQDRRYPEYFDARRRLVRRVLLAASTRRARRVIAIGPGTAGDLARFVGTPPAKVRVVPHGVDPDLARVSDAAVAEVRARYSLPERFAFYPAKTFPHKNHATLLDAIATLRGRGVEVPLVLTGGRDLAHEAVLSRIAAPALTGLARHLGFVPPEEIGPLYRAATLLAFPSLFEGFGLPLVEAMACGVPVVAADVPGTRDVAGDAALLVPPTDEAAWADAIARVWTDPALRADRIDRGRARAASFSWERCARETFAVLAEAAGRGR
jgi:glycosyltransferase involved in cell wall biosynthesis